MQDTFVPLHNLDVGIGFIPGVAGCGKSSVMELFTILPSHFGNQKRCWLGARPHSSVVAPQKRSEVLEGFRHIQNMRVGEIDGPREMLLTCLPSRDQN